MASSDLDPPKKTDKHNYLGIEIECSITYPKSKHDTDEWGYRSYHDYEGDLHEIIKKHGLEKCLSFGDDGTPTTSDEDSIEFQLLTKESELDNNLVKLGKMLKELKANCNTSHGLHVHLDMRNRDPYMSFIKLLKSQDILYKAVNKSRRDNGYCEKIDTSQPNRVFQAMADAGGKDLGINPVLRKEQNTIELRMKEGTVNVDNISNWCKLLVSIVDGPYVTKPISSVKDLSRIALDKSLVDYVKKSIKSSSKSIPKSRW